MYKALGWRGGGVLPPPYTEKMKHGGAFLKDCFFLNIGHLILIRFSLINKKNVRK